MCWVFLVTSLAGCWPYFYFFTKMIMSWLLSTIVNCDVLHHNALHLYFSGQIILRKTLSIHNKNLTSSRNNVTKDTEYYYKHDHLYVEQMNNWLNDRTWKKKRENTANDDQKSCCFQKKGEINKNKKEEEGWKKGQRIK